MLIRPLGHWCTVASLLLAASAAMIGDLRLSLVSSADAGENDTYSVASATTEQPALPALVGNGGSAVARIRIDVEGESGAPPEVTAITVQTRGTTSLTDIEMVEVFYSGDAKEVWAPSRRELFSDAVRFSTPHEPSGSIEFSGRQALKPGANFFWVSYRLKQDANLDHVVDAGCSSIELSDGSIITPTESEPVGLQRMGLALRRAGDDGAHTYRIPGLATTNDGTLIAVYDIRRSSGADLPADIDVGMSRSDDGGRNWEPMRVIMDCGQDPSWQFDGVGDPAVLVDRATNTIWVAAVWCHGKRGWSGSGSGLEPQETGQLMLVRSDDDGCTWSKPINITKQVKRPEWCFLLQGPGKGISLADGTLAFAAQYQDSPENKRLPHSTIIYSRDHGQTWKCGSGAYDDTTEAQLVEIEPGVLMLNCRYNRTPYRAIATTADLGATWKIHPTSETALCEPVACMASLIHIDRELGISGGRRLLFSNPNSLAVRERMTLKLSSDSGATWAAESQLLLDEGRSYGYSCLSMIDERTVGILYEGSQSHLTFQRIPLGAIGNASASKLTRDP